MKSSLYSPQLEKVHAQQQRPSTAKNKSIIYLFIYFSIYFYSLESTYFTIL